MNNKVKVAVVGLGRAGWNLHVKALRGREDFMIVDLADPDQERCRTCAEEFGCGVHASLDDLLKSTKAELIVIATPNRMHVDDAIQVMRSGRDCVVEKPISSDHVGAMKLVDTARETGRLLFPHHQRRFSDELRVFKEVIDSNLLGKIFEIRLFWGGYARRNDWQTLAKNGGGVLNNHGPHALDLLLALADSEVTSLSANLQHVKDAGDVDDHAHLFMRTEKGQTIEATMSSSCALPSPRTMILGANGTLSAELDKATLRYYDPSKLEVLEVDEKSPENRDYGTGETIPWVDEERPISTEINSTPFYDNVYGVIRENFDQVVTPESAAEVIRMIEWAYREASEFKSKR